MRKLEICNKNRKKPGKKLVVTERIFCKNHSPTKHAQIITPTSAGRARFSCIFFVKFPICADIRPIFSENVIYSNPGQDNTAVPFPYLSLWRNYTKYISGQLQKHMLCIFLRGAYIERNEDERPRKARKRATKRKKNWNPKSGKPIDYGEQKPMYWSWKNQKKCSLYWNLVLYTVPLYFPKP